MKGGLLSEEVHEVMDLCLECKACKAECPSNVDMAKLKYEYLAHYHREHGYPLRSYLFGYIGRFAPVGLSPGAGVELDCGEWTQPLVPRSIFGD